MSGKLKYWISLLALGYMGGTIFLLPYIRYSFYTQMQETILSNGEPITNTQIGLLSLVFSWVTCISMVPGGYLADRLDAKKIIIFSVGGTTILTFIHAMFISSYPIAMAVWAGMGISTGFCYWPALQKFIFTLGNLEEAAQNYGKYYLINGLSGALGNFIPIWVCETLGFGYRGVVWAVGVITLIATIGVMVFLESEADKVARGVVFPKDDPIQIKEVPKVLIWPGFWLYWLAGNLTYLLYAEVAYMTPYLVDVMGVDPGVSSIYSTFRTYVAMVMAPVGGWMADKVLGKTTKWFMLGGIIIAVLLAGLFMFKPGGNMTILCIYTVIPSLIIMPIYAVTKTIYRESGLPQAVLGTVIGIAALIGTVLPLVDGIVPVVYGHWLDKYGNHGYTIIFWTLIIGALLLVIDAFAMLKFNGAVQKGKISFRKATPDAEEEAAPAEE